MSADRGPERAPASSERACSMVVLKNVRVPMRDGIGLATDVYLPATADGRVSPGRWPVILGRTSYDKESAWLWIQPVVDYFVPRGYAVVLQDLRGRHRSEGTGQYFHTVNPREGTDGYDTVEWIAAQPWSNGRVGAVGVSHGAVVQAAMALYRPPHLTALWMDDSFFNWFANGARQGGALEVDTLGMMFLHGHDSHEAAADPAVARVMGDAAQHLREWVMRMPLKPGCSPLAAIPSLEAVFFDYYTRGDYDEFWGQDCINFEASLERFADIPVVLRSGWFDVFALAHGLVFPRLAALKSTPTRLILGPWVHGGCDRSYAGDVDFGPSAALDGVHGPSFNDLRLRWFDHWLTDVPNGADEDPAVRIFVMGGGTGRRTAQGRLDHGGRWRSETEWPLGRTRFTPHYFRQGGLLSPQPPAADTPPVTYAFDPAHPVPTISGNVASFYEHLPVPDGILPAMSPPRSRMRSIVLQGPSHQQEAPHILGSRPPYPPLGARPDVLVFQTPPLERDVEVTGPIEVRLWVLSSAPDTDFTAMLLDIYPPSPDYAQGYDMNLTDGIQRARYRNGYEKAELMTPGEIYPVAIRLAATSNVFQAGHRIRVQISSSNFPRFDVNPNTGEPLGRHTHLTTARNTLYLDAARPSHIVLPIIPS